MTVLKFTQILGLLCLSVSTVLAQTTGQPTTPVQPGQAETPTQPNVRDKNNTEQMQQMQQMDVQQLLNRFDSNQDGSITKNELPNRLQDHFAKCDKNSDGKLDQEELREHALKMNAQSDQGQQGYLMVYEATYDPISLNDLQSTYQMLTMIDGDHDGKITQKEVTDAQQKVRMHHADSVFKEWDKNGDGKLMKEEVPNRLQSEFDTVDTDHDNHLTKEEMEKAFMAQPMKKDNADSTNEPNKR